MAMQKPVSDNKPRLSVDLLKMEAGNFVATQPARREKSLFGVTDGKAVGTYLEHDFQGFLQKKYTYEKGNSAKGIDFPGLYVDIKVTSTRQPQSSCPFKSAAQKIYGLGYSLLIFVYIKRDDHKKNTAILEVKHVIFVESEHTADYQTTTGLLKIIENNANEDDVVAFMAERLLPVDDMQARQLARKILRQPPAVGYLTISNALQWRLQYSRAIEQAGKMPGICRIF